MNKITKAQVIEWLTDCAGYDSLMIAQLDKEDIKDIIAQKGAEIIAYTR